MTQVTIAHQAPAERHLARREPQHVRAAVGRRPGISVCPALPAGMPDISRHGPEHATAAANGAEMEPEL